MTELMSQEEMHRNAAELIRLRAQIPVQAWPRFGKDVTLVDENGPAGSLLFSCHIDAAMCNPMGSVHGGVTASLVDTCMGVTCTVQRKRVSTPTITMTVNYVRPVPLDADVQVRTHTIRIGSTAGQMSAEVFLADKPEEILVTATGIYAIRH